MKPLFILISLFVYFSTTGQNLKNSEWVQIKVERKDGSRILDQRLSGTSVIKYHFTDSLVFSALNDQYSTSPKYSVHDGVLSIGDYLNYSIDTINNVIMALTEIPLHDVPDDKVNSYVFINTRFLFDYLNQKGEIFITGDSMIKCNNLFSPTYNGNFTDILMSEFDGIRFKGELAGTFILSPGGAVKKITLENTGLPKSEIRKFTSLLQGTSNKWVMPATPKPLSFQISFSLTINSEFSGMSFSITFNKNEQRAFSEIMISYPQLIALDNYFKKGTELFAKEKWEKALAQFTKCIEIDSLYTDAYYNSAACFQKLGNMESACEMWRKLKDMGQKQGELLYSENCGMLRKDNQD